MEIRQGACQFVKRIVPSDVFTENEAPIGLPKRRGVDRSRLYVQLLAGR
jgi:hypothetical protein